MGIDRRRNFYIKKGFQFRFILPFLIVSFLSLVVSITFFTLIAHAKIDSVLYSMRMPETVMSALFLKEAFISNIAAVGGVVIMFIFTTRGIFRKVAGPLSSVQYGLRRLREGDLLARIHLRAGDEFNDIGARINKMAESLSYRFGHINNHARQLDRRLKELAWAPEGKDRKAIVEKIRVHVLEMEEQLRAFKK